MRRLAAAAFLLWSIVAIAAQVQAQTLPRPTGRVSDGAGVLTSAARADLESLLTTLQRDTTADVVVATTPSLNGKSVEEYGNRVFNEWRLGKAALDNGVLVLVAPTERQVRIEVGYGLEGVLPDAVVGAIIRDDFLPRFRDGNYEAGIVAGVRHVADVVRAKQVLPLERPAATESSRRSVLDWILFGTVGTLWLAGVVMAGAALGQAVSLRSGPNLLFGILAIGIFAGLPIAFLPRLAFVLVPVALAGGAWGYRRRPLSGGSSHDASESTWDWSLPTGSSGSSGSDSSSSSSDSSDRGGSSGGGGASGSW